MRTTAPSRVSAALSRRPAVVSLSSAPVRPQQHRPQSQPQRVAGLRPCSPPGAADRCGRVHQSPLTAADGRRRRSSQRRAPTALYHFVARQQTAGTGRRPSVNSAPQRKNTISSRHITRILGLSEFTAFLIGKNSVLLKPRPGFHSLAGFLRPTAIASPPLSDTALPPPVSSPHRRR